MLLVLSGGRKVYFTAHNFPFSLPQVASLNVTHVELGVCVCVFGKGSP